MAKAAGITLMYYTAWPNPFVHCHAGSNQPWTQVPGLKLMPSQVGEFPAKTGDGGWFGIYFPTATWLEFLMNDGVPAKWDKARGGANYEVQRTGLWTLCLGALTEYAPGAGAGTGETGIVPAVEGLALAPGAAQGVACTAGLPHEVARQKGGIVLLYRTTWPSAYVHFRMGSSEPWTTTPGQPLKPSILTGFPASAGWWALHFLQSQILEFLPNDGDKLWDKAANGANYFIPKAGAWQLADGRLQEIVAPLPAPAVAARVSEVPSITKEPPSVPLGAALSKEDVKAVSASLAEVMLLDGIVLLYRTAWASPHLHGRTTEQWTTLPGVELPPADAALVAELDLDVDGGHGQLFALHVPKAPSLEFVLNDGGPHYRWDKAAGGANFLIPTAGLWLLSGGRLEKVQPPPSAPADLVVQSATRNSVSLAWSSTMDSVRSYRVFRDGKLIGTVAGGLKGYSDLNLFAAREYRYTVAAVSTQGVQGPCSKVAVAKTQPAGRPGVPQALRVALANGKGVTLEWELPEDNGGAPITAYTIERDGKPFDTVLAPQGSVEEKTTWTDSNVEQGGKYSYTVAACHLPPKGELRDKVLSDRAERVAPEDHDVLLGLSEDLNVGPSTAPLDAEAVDELETAECKEDLREQLNCGGITIYYKTTWASAYAHARSRPELGWTPLPGLPFSPSVTWAFPAEDGWCSLYMPHARSLEMVLNDGGREWDKAPGQQNYKVSIPGVLKLEHGHMDRVAAPPQAPTALTGKGLDGSRVRLTWKAPPLGEGEAPVLRYKVFRNGRLVRTTENGAACEFLDKNLFAFTDYEYSVAAVNNQEVSGPLSASYTVKTDLPGPPSAPRNLRASVKKQDGQVQVKLEWEPPEDCGGAPVASYEILRDGRRVDVFNVPNVQLRGEAEACRPIAPEASAGRRWLRHSSSYSNLSWFKDALSWEDLDVKVGSNCSYQVQALQLGPGRAEELRAEGLQQRCGSRFLDNVLEDVVGPPCDPVSVRAVPFLDAPRLGEPKCVIMFQAFDWGSCKASCWYDILLGLLPELRTAGINMMWLPPPSDSVDDHAYLPRKWYVLDNKYGSAAALQRLITAMHEQEMVPMLDVVVNHRCASKQDSAGRWLKFEDPDWEGWAVCRDSRAVPGGTGAPVSGEPAQYAPSIDHQNPRVREDVNAYIRYMMTEIGFRALRFDFVKGYAPHFQKDYVCAAGSPFAVAENWNGDVNGLHEYVRQCQGKMAVYDFPLYYALKRCVQTNNFSELNVDGKLAGMVGRDPARAVTFIDNHDTYQLAIVGGAFGNNQQVTRAYALILTHPGVPCVFHFDYVRGADVRGKLLHLCSIRRDAGIHSTSSLRICEARYGLYAAVVAEKVAMKIGSDDWSPGGGWKFACAGHEFCVWTRG